MKEGSYDKTQRVRTSWNGPHLLVHQKNPRWTARGRTWTMFNENIINPPCCTLIKIPASRKMMMFSKDQMQVSNEDKDIYILNIWWKCFASFHRHIWIIINRVKNTAETWRTMCTVLYCTVYCDGDLPYLWWPLAYAPQLRRASPAQAAGQLEWPLWCSLVPRSHWSIAMVLRSHWSAWSRQYWALTV